MSSERIRWTPEERDAIVACAVQYARGRTTSRLEALLFGMRTALTDQSRHRNCVSVSHFGSYINAEFDHLLHTTEKMGEPLPKVGRTSTGEDIAPPPQPRPAETASVPVAPGTTPALPSVLADDEELVLNIPDVVIPGWIVNRIAAYVESRVMTRVMAIMTAAQGHTLTANLESRVGIDIEADPVIPQQKPSKEGAKLQVIVIGFMPQRKQWLLSAIPSRLRNRLDIEFYFEQSVIPRAPDHIIIHCTMKERSEVPQTLLSPGRYYRSALSPMAVLSNIETAADYHLTKIDQGK